MIFNNINREFEYILWLKERLGLLRFGVTHKVKTDSSTDFEMLKRKLQSYEQEYSRGIDELYELLLKYDVLRKTNNFR